MAISVTCQCGRCFEVGDDQDGHPAQCPGCGFHVAVQKDPDHPRQKARYVDVAPSPLSAIATGGPKPAAVADTGWWIGAALMLVNGVFGVIYSATLDNTAGHQQSDSMIPGAAVTLIFALVMAIGLACGAPWAKFVIIVLSGTFSLLVLLFMPKVIRQVFGGMTLGTLVCLAQPVGWILLLEQRASIPKIVIGVVLLLSGAAAAVIMQMQTT